MRYTPIMARLEFFFDCSSPWTYLAFHRIEALAAETGAVLDWRPSVRKPLVRYLTPVLRPLFRSNHAWTMRRGLESALRVLDG